jgi:hypothetical protein
VGREWGRFLRYKYMPHEGEKGGGQSVMYIGNVRYLALEKLIRHQISKSTMILTRFT